MRKRGKETHAGAPNKKKERKKGLPHKCHFLTFFNEIGNGIFIQIF